MAGVKVLSIISNCLDGVVSGTIILISFLLVGCYLQIISSHIAFLRKPGFYFGSDEGIMLMIRSQQLIVSPARTAIFVRYIYQQSRAWVDVMRGALLELYADELAAEQLLWENENLR